MLYQAQNIILEMSNLMKQLIYRFMLTITILLSSCKVVQEESPIIYTLSSEKRVFNSLEDIIMEVSLTNSSNKSILVNGRMAFRTQSFYPPEAIEGLFLITDSLNKPVIMPGKIDIEFPKSDSFVVLLPDSSIQKNIKLRNLGFDAQDFKTNEVYSVTVVYQNSLDVKQTVDGREIQAWKGRVVSNTISFEIVSP